MRLKKIKLAGFKSFVDPTSIPFPGDMTAIVGPNGCGKSNVIDAVRWVLGESSAKNLRGDAMTDVIFNGSSARKPIGQSSVELVFDNSSQRIDGEYANYNELAIKRVVTRDAQSTYYLNGSKCRRRDVTDLFLGTGLGPRSYAIIEQGMISRLIESKPQELRVFIEEAAGISKYKERRRETENRIRHTQENLERLEDVRGELGKQLEKLQRQAATAKRYKTLKATERQLKGELAAIRWLKHTDHVAVIEQKQRKLQNEIEELVARQRGDEAGLIRFRNEQQLCKDTLDDLRQQLFTIGAAITRIEQNALHSKQRKDQINQELAQYDQKFTELTNQKETAEQSLKEIDDELAKLLPQQSVVAEQLEQAEYAKDEAELAYNAHRRQFQEQDQAHQQVKSQVQACHSQVQSTLSMQMRTQQRLSELEQERDELSEAHWQDAIEEAKLSVEEVSERLDNLVVDTEQVSERKHEATLNRDTVVKAYQQSQLSYQALVSSLAALEALQLDSQSDKQINDAYPLWQYCQPKAGWESTFEQVLTALGDARFCDGVNIDNIAKHAHYDGVMLFDTQYFSEVKRPGTLAEQLTNPRVPIIFNTIHTAASLDDAILMRPSLADGHSVITNNGSWLSKDTYLHGNTQSDDGVLQRATKIASLKQEKDLQLEVCQNQEQLVSQANDKLQMAEQDLDTIRQDVAQCRGQLQQKQNELTLLENQQQQIQQRQSKNSEEFTRYSDLLATEEAQLAQLSEQLEMLEEQSAELAEQITEHTQAEDRLRAAMQHQRQTAEQLTSTVHQLELKIQQLQNQHQLHSTHLATVLQQQADYHQRQRLLRNELAELEQPMEQQGAQLQDYLAQREALEEQQLDMQVKLGEAEQQIQLAQQDQQGLAAAIKLKQTEDDSLNLEAEGYRVRASAVIEQLEESGQSLKSIIDTLDESADETQWQQQLDQTAAAVGRLGAVNLAAVEEYDIQAQRKAHLDAQNDDLAEALDTLQSAIRKIDKETKARFSATFEQVNNDLKALFPKVFGGGSAYLALTDDDLLETGVTIMARPPGKKNSTIHLLSGGEKALTALSLVFAIFRLNPAPFCMLDEVDAPLDDANVGRFCKLVSEMSESVQFIYITHNKIAMEMASHLTGVTMAEPGVSRMVAVDVEEAIAFADA